MHFCKFFFTLNVQQRGLRLENTGKPELGFPTLHFFTLSYSLFRNTRLFISATSVFERHSEIRGRGCGFVLLYSFINVSVLGTTIVSLPPLKIHCRITKCFYAL